MLSKIYTLFPPADQYPLSLNGDISGGLCWDRLTKSRLSNPKALEPYGFKVYSQSDEDGIIQEIFRRIGTTNQIFVEFGVQDGLESNAHYLLLKGWSGLWIEGSSSYTAEICTKFKPVIDNQQLKIRNEFITCENINSIIQSAGLGNEIDLLSIDIDGNDYYIWNEIHVINPRVVVIEYNGKFPPDFDWKMAYNPTHVWDGSDWHGASLKALEKLGQQKGYQLVGTNLIGANAFFVRNDLTSDLFLEPATAENLYNPLRMDLHFKAYHPARYCLSGQRQGYGILNYTNIDLVSGFHSIEKQENHSHVWTSSYESHLRLLAPSSCDYIEIPYVIPDKILALGPYSIDFTVQGIHFSYTITDKSQNTFCLSRRECSWSGDIVDIFIRVQKLWNPCVLFDTQDNRELGINILLSGIQFQ